MYDNCYVFNRTCLDCHQGSNQQYVLRRPEVSVSKLFVPLCLRPVHIRTQKRTTQLYYSLYKPGGMFVYFVYFCLYVLVNISS